MDSSSLLFRKIEPAGKAGKAAAHHARLHSRVGAFDLGHVEEAGGAADEGAAGE